MRLPTGIPAIEGRVDCQSTALGRKPESRAARDSRLTVDSTESSPRSRLCAVDHGGRVNGGPPATAYGPLLRSPLTAPRR
ncbi:hypothetical protein D7Y44_00810 [Stenotrophomonas maltophilia]|nr:hypothetical protein [Stenotrophomonas maltophilia]MBA0343753.1 hypothetical protein [Stenotrophomonas maltophilia]MBA0355992.1 hypothetical protein [Stenotrophomonas maltophilia]MBA0518013.1 hypothetical protein [Stenotrophomonas maltophilia]